MPTPSRERLQVAVALSRGAALVAREVALSAQEARNLAGLLDALTRQGAVACFAIAPAPPSSEAAQLVDVLRAHLGATTVDAISAAGLPRLEPAPAFLLSVWPFDHRVGGQPAATGQFLGLDLELVASASPDAEVGFYLEGVTGPQLLHTRPIGARLLARKTPSTAP